jgi:hypothetical protein
MQDVVLCQQYWQQIIHCANIIRAGCCAESAVLAADHTFAPTLSGHDAVLCQQYWQ